MNQNKVTKPRLGGKKVSENVVEEEVNVEELMQGECEQDVSLYTVDEVVRGVPVVPQPKGPAPVPPFTRYGTPGPGHQPLESLLPAMYPSPGQAPPPLNILNQNSPPLPLPGPLHLVYLQPSPHGLNIIPWQAVGCPTFTPSSPLGFPAHPHHPVVVQSPHLPPPFPSPPYGPDKQGQIFPGHNQPLPPGFYPPQNTSHLPPQTQTKPDSEKDGEATPKKIFRPWEDQSTALQSGLSNLKIS